MRYRRKKKRKFGGMLLLICLIFLILIYVLLLSPLFEIRAVEISGNKNINAEEIRSNFNYKNIFLVTEGKIRNDLLKKFPKISDLEIDKNLIKRVVKLVIEEREGVGIVCQVEKVEKSTATEPTEDKIKDCFYLDKEGVIFEEVPQTSGSLILLIKDYSQREFTLGKKVFDEDLINFILEARESLSSEVDLKALDFNILSFPPSDLKVVTGEGWYIIFSLERDIKGQVLALKAALQEKIKDRKSLEYVDLRIENRIYYK